MLTRVTSVLIGKDIDRTASLVIGGSSENIVEGEVVVLDKNKNILSAGSTVNDTDIIYIVQALGTTMTYSNPAGTSITVRNLKFSNPIEGKLVKKYTAVAFDPKVEKTVSFAAISAPLTAGTEYILRLVFKDVHEKRGQFTKTYRYISTGTTSLAVFDALRAQILADSGARVTTNATGTATLILTAKEISACTTALTDIDNFSMVDFDAYLTYIDSSGYHQTVTSTKTAGTVEHGSGNWEQVRDLEKAEWGYEGISNRTQFPVKLPTQCTVVDAIYDMIVIESDRHYQSPDNQYVKQTPLTTIICLPVRALQTTDILGVLNPWMESVGFSAVTF